MKLTLKRTAYFTGIIFLVFLFACCKENTPKISNSYASGITENSVVLNWSTSNGEYTSAEVLIRPEDGSGYSIEELVENPGNLNEMSHKFEGLSGLTKFYYEISLHRGAEVLDEFEGYFRTLYSSDHLELHTRDGYTLSGNIYYLAARDKQVPVVIMMHGLNQSIQPWEDSRALELLIKNGYACMTFYYRGHRFATPGFDTRLFKSDDGAYYMGCDLEAAIKAVNGHKAVLPDNIGMMGGSLGAIGSVLGTLFPEVKASVALGPAIQPGQKPMQQFFPELLDKKFKSVSYIAGDLDIVDADYVFNIAKDSRRYYDMTLDPKEIWIIENCSDHGSALANQPGVLERMLNWYVKHLPSPYHE